MLGIILDIASIVLSIIAIVYVAKNWRKGK